MKFIESRYNEAGMEQKVFVSFYKFSVTEIEIMSDINDVVNYAGGSGGVLPQLNIKSSVEFTSIVFIKDSLVLVPEKTGEDQYFIEVPSLGNWEVHFSYNGLTMIKNFLIDVCKIYDLDLYDPLVPIISAANSNVVSYPGNFHTYYDWWVFNRENDGDTQAWVVRGNYNNGTAYIGYKFDIPHAVFKVYVKNRSEPGYPRAPKTFKVQGSDNGSTWVDVSDQVFTFPNNNVNTESYFELSQTTFYLYWRILILTVYDTEYLGIGRLQFYGL